MPRLSDFLAADPPPVRPAAAGAAAPPAAAAAAAGVLGLPRPPPPPRQRAAAQGEAAIKAKAAAAGSDSGGAAAAGDAAAARLRQVHARRLRTHRPRQYRHADGSLRDAPPPREPLVVANRRRWAPIVQHCRGLAGLGSTPQRRAEELAAVGLEPEIGVDGGWLGFVPGLEDPLEDDPAHPLWGEEWGPAAAEVLERAREIGNLARALGGARAVAGGVGGPAAVVGLGDAAAVGSAGSRPASPGDYVMV
ncbi:hypothetical protein Rsub_04939 [Raphidocelis subcapitata]|uniref:Uncharacterized protein n=1 Tax=Raphidocelis subcapitata TaxID=307507 RepID=A0A2V0NW18_9CHLO|nr:hypothetical protein Rsub_04939 [Raphidocelis subcapitata]|eukprot:GBF91834.1 hypothetical protein Rsub_04939 [Raphidocelis subcapitata]